MQLQEINPPPPHILRHCPVQQLCRLLFCQFLPFSLPFGPPPPKYKLNTLNSLSGVVLLYCLIMLVISYFMRWCSRGTYSSNSDLMKSSTTTSLCSTRLLSLVLLLTSSCAWSTTSFHRCCFCSSVSFCGFESSPLCSICKKKSTLNEEN